MQTATSTAAHLERQILGVAPDLASYDLILVNTSGGKDSSVMAHQVAQLAKAAGVIDRVVLVNATFAEEWAGVEELVRRQAAALDLPLEICQREIDGTKQNLLDYVIARKQWPSSKARYCTSEFKRGPIDKVITRLVNAAHQGSQVRVLNCMGLRAEESPKRAQNEPFKRDERRTNGRRIVDQWLPVFRMTEGQVWDYIELHGIEQHQAYKLGMPRLSCVFCVMHANLDTHMLAGQHNPELLAKYVEVEQRIGSQFHAKFSLASIQARLAAGERADMSKIKSWKM